MSSINQHKMMNMGISNARLKCLSFSKKKKKKEAEEEEAAIAFPKYQTFQIVSRQQTHSGVGISGFTDTACPRF